WRDLNCSHIGRQHSSSYVRKLALTASPAAFTTAGNIKPTVCRVVIYLQRDMSGESCLHPLRPRTDPVLSISSTECPKIKTCSQRDVAGSKYVRLNVGGALYYSTVQVLTRQDTLLKSMFSGKMEVFTDKEGWILIDRCGKHFGSILSYLRDGSVTLPKSRQGVMELFTEAKYYEIQGLVDLCQHALQVNMQKALCVIPVITSHKEEEKLIQGCTRPAVKLLYNRGNNKYSYTSNSDDNLLKNIELFEKLSLSYNGRVLFIKDIIGDEICCWSFYGQGRKLAEVCCTSIVYATEKKQTK
ncbi:BTB/POZ domain-containing adapter for CUL3-mediated RhoA degradation protein 2-like, partial [Clarias magur]